MALQGLEAASLYGFSCGTLLIGMAIGVGQQYRFAALDLCSEEQRPRAIGVVMGGGVIAAILGANLAIWSQDWADKPFVGAFYGLLGIYLVALFLISVLPLAKGVKVKPTDRVRSYSELFKQPLLIAAIASGVVGYAIMVLLMTATPLAMDQQQFPFASVAMVIQWHVLGMFVPSFFTGWLIRKFSTRSVILAGCLILLICAVINMAGDSYWHYFVGLLLLGVGWNFTFIGATNLLSYTYSPAEQGKVQGINEFLVFSAAAVGGLLAGQGVVLVGWTWLNALSIPVVLVIAWLIWRLDERKMTEQAQQAWQVTSN